VAEEEEEEAGGSEAEVAPHHVEGAIGRINMVHCKEQNIASPLRISPLVSHGRI